MKLIVDSLSFGYPHCQPLLKEVSFSAEGGELISLLGPNGTGKTTLFRCILGQLRASGTITLDGQPLSALSPRHLAAKVAYIPQSHSPAFSYPVEEMILMGAAAGLKWFQHPGRAERERLDEVMDNLGLQTLRGRAFDTLSGGEQQLVMMARAMMTDARVWLLDEPAANLDYGNQTRLLLQLQQLAAKGYLLIQSTHSPQQAALYSSRVLALADGVLAGDGDPAKVLDAGMIQTLYGLKVKAVDIPSGGRDVRVFLPDESKYRKEM